MAVRSYEPGMNLGCFRCDINLRDMTLGEGHDKTLGNGQQLCEILSRSNMVARSYDSDTDLDICMR